MLMSSASCDFVNRSQIQPELMASRGTIADYLQSRSLNTQAAGGGASAGVWPQG